MDSKAVRQQFIRSYEERSQGTPLNQEQKRYIRTCPIEELFDVNGLATKISDLALDRESRDLFAKLHDQFTTTEISSAAIRRLLVKTGTDVVRNDNDPYGDGDQTLVEGDEFKHQILRSLFADGGDLEYYLRESSQIAQQYGIAQAPATATTQLLPPFAMMCIAGDAPGVERFLKRELYSRDHEARRQLLEYRYTSMRLSPLLLTVALSKHPATAQRHTGRAVANMDHVNVFRILLKYGANPNVKDVTGKTVCHYGAGTMATASTLQMTEMAIKANRTSAMHGREVVLRGLSKAEYNGMKGILGGYVAETDRRVFYPNPGSPTEKELSIKPENIFVALAEEGSATDGSNSTSKEVCILDACADTINLVNVRDRLGSISMHEVAMSARDDVALFLCRQCPSCLDVEEASNKRLSIRQMMLLPNCRVNEVLKRHAAKMSRRDDKERNLQKEVCENCNKRSYELGMELLQCSRCLAAYYCSRDCQVSHWKTMHKKECPQREKQGELQLGSRENVIHKGCTMPAGIRGSGKKQRDMIIRYEPPIGCKTNDKFWIKAQAGELKGNDNILVYDETRHCVFLLSSQHEGYNELKTKVQEQKAFLGKKSYFKAKFNEQGNCMVYLHTSSAQKW